VPILPLIGHRSLRERLGAAIDRGSLPGSLLLQGPQGVGKQRLALWVGQRLLCEGANPKPCGECQHCRYALRLAHPDLHWFYPQPRPKDSTPSLDDVRRDYGEVTAERAAAQGLYAAPGGEEGIYVATVRAIVQIAGLKPALARRKVFVVGDADRMVSQDGADQAANAFLKLLEEPPANTTIILTSSEPGALLPTIRSRVVAIRVPPLTDEQVLEFLEAEPVRVRLDRDLPRTTPDERLAIARGAPGRLLAYAAYEDALARARRLLDAVVQGDRAEKLRIAFAQGGSKARAGFSDALDALTVLLRDRTRNAIERNDAAQAAGSAQAVAAVERAKDEASGNANPQLITVTLMRALESSLK
jgi:DNA polymerase III subunit delta'